MQPAAALPPNSCLPPPRPFKDETPAQLVMGHSPDLHCILKVENNSNKPVNIRGIFSSAGEIPQLYPYDTGVPRQFHYFVEYRHRGSVDRARQLRLGSSAGLVVYPIHSDQRLVKQFRSCRAYGPSYILPKQDESAIWPSPAAGQPAAPSTRSGGRKPLFSATSADFARPPPDCECSTKDSGDSNVRLTTNAPEEAPVRAPNTMHIGTSTDGPGNVYTVDIPAPLTLDSRLFIKIQGQGIVYDLAKDQDQDPKIVIELLKLSLSERGNWMIAGAHFRRVGKPRAAIDIMYAMLEVMVKNGFVEAKLKPVFLLLSGCELDMAISARNAGDLTASEQHYANVQMWLHKVYGTPAPASGPTSFVTPSGGVQPKLPQPEPSQPSHSREIDCNPPHRTNVEHLPTCKRKREESIPAERNIRRRHSGPPRVMKFKDKRRYASNKENQRFK